MNNEIPRRSDSCSWTQFFFEDVDHLVTIGLPALFSFALLPLLGIMKNDPHGMSTSRSDAADPVSHVDPVDAASPLHRSMMHWENHRLPPLKRHHFSSRLHPGTLFGEYKFPSGEVMLRLRQQNRDLQRKDMLPIQILMQTVVISLLILQQKRSRAHLPGMMTALYELLMILGKADIDSHLLIPDIRQ